MNTATAPASLFAAIIAAGIPYANHHSDLYLPDTPAVRALLDLFPVNRDNASGFINQAPPHKGERWLDVPFAFLPYWEERQAKPVHGTQPNPHGFCDDQLKARRNLGDNLTETPPEGCALRVGQLVEVTNGNGLTANGFRRLGVFYPFRVLGFTAKPHSCGTVYVYTDAWWMPTHAANVAPVPQS